MGAAISAQEIAGCNRGEPVFPLSIETPTRRNTHSGAKYAKRPRVNWGALGDSADEFRVTG